MKLHRVTASLALAVALAAPASSQTAKFAAPLAEEPIPAVEKLSVPYPASYILVHDFNFNSLPDGRGAVVDTANPSAPLKGTVQIAQFGNVLIGNDAKEIYSAETYYSRLARGTRTDVITIWDKETLAPKGEIILPGGKRNQQVTYKSNFQFTNGQKWALVANFTPAQSVTVVDLENRKVLGDIELPGCALIYPTGERGFATFCADSTVTSVQLGADGKLAKSVTSKPTLEIDKQPLFGMAAMVGKTAWFLSYSGQLRAFDMSGPVAVPLGKPFALPKTEGGAPEWRPSGWQVMTSDTSGKLYILMNPAGKEGSHKDGGTEVWVIDPVTQTRTARFPLTVPGASIEVTRETAPRLIVSRIDTVIDVHDATTGALIHSLGTRTASSPLTMSVID